MKNYEIYLLDTETSGLNPMQHDVIELSICRFSTGEIKTWHLQPLNFETIDQGALRVNNIKLEDLKHLTTFGKETYKNPKDVIIEVENWIAEDELPKEQRVMTAHNVVFDKTMLEQLWRKCDSSDSFPFGRRSLDTSSLEFFMDLCSPEQEMALGYSLSNLTKKYKLTNMKAHSAEGDTKVLLEVFKKQVEFFKQKLK